MGDHVDLLKCQRRVSAADARRAAPPAPTGPLVLPTRAVPPMPPMLATQTQAPVQAARTVPPMPPAQMPAPAPAPAPDPTLAPVARTVPPMPPGYNGSSTDARQDTDTRHDAGNEPDTGAAQAESVPDAVQVLTDVLAELVPVDDVRTDGNFFDDLGADSMVMARFCARLRKQPGMPSVSMKDVYENPTIDDLAASLTLQAPPQAAPMTVAASTTMDVSPPVSTSMYVLCGLLQFMFFAGYSFLTTLVAVKGFLWISDSSGLPAIYLRSVALISATFLVTSLIPIVAKWVLIGRWKPEPIRIWSLGYFRFWVVKTLIRTSPIVLLNGRSATSSSSPLYPMYLRALGAKVGRGVTILSKSMPVCTDLLTIGDHTVVQKDSLFNCYRAKGGVIEPGTVTLGKHVFIGEATVIDINTTVENGAQLGHTSSLQAGQTIPVDSRYQGTPARPVDLDHRIGNVAVTGSRRRVIYSIYQLVSSLLLAAPLTFTIVVLLAANAPAVRAIVRPDTSTLNWFETARNVAIVSASLLVISTIFGLLLAGTIPRMLKRFVEPGKTYPLYGFHYVVHRTIARMTNVQFFNSLFGDSSYIVHYLRWIGYDLSDYEQTGSNFGTQVKHESPFLTSVGKGTVVADGLSAMNASFSSTSFRVDAVAIGSNNFLGNGISYPAKGLTGNDCLLATKVAIPVSGEVREGVGLLGSPSFQIPRTVERDRALEIRYNEELIRPLLLGAKNRHNLVTMSLFLLTRWVLGFVLLMMLAGIFVGHETHGNISVAVAVVALPLITVGYWGLVEKFVGRLQALEPDGCSIYHRNFWRHERYWKIPAFAYLGAYNGTPFKTMIWRMLGVRMGARVFDDGCFFVEKTFATVGDHCTLNVGTTVQCHSQEDGGFKSDRTSIASGCTLGVGAFVHYGVTVGEGAELSADSFLMKGQEIPPQTTWAGNPAQEVSK